MDATRKKISRMGLEVVVPRGYRTTTSLELPKELPSAEEALKIPAGVLNAASKLGFDRGLFVRLCSTLELHSQR